MTLFLAQVLQLPGSVSRRNRRPYKLLAITCADLAEGLRIGLLPGGHGRRVQAAYLKSHLDLASIDKWMAAQREFGGATFTNLFMRRCGLA